MSYNPKLAERQELEASQLEQLRTLVAELFPGNRFYSEKYATAGITFDVASLGDFSQRFPFTTKAEVVENQLRFPPFGTNLTYSLDRYTRFHQTSGTTGTPLRWLDTAESWDWMVENWERVFAAAGAGGGDRVYFAFSFGPFIGFWLAFESAGRMGMLCIPGGGLSSAARLKAMLDNRVTILCCTPTYALRLAEVSAQEKIPMPKSVRRIIVAGEPGGSVPAVRSRIEELWQGARVFDHHGMTEVGPVSYECPAQANVLHVIESGYYAEVVEPDTGKIAEPGATGELVLTTLGRTGSPLLRYRTGDLVRLAPRRGEPCKCGSVEMALAGGILGRADDMVVVRGVNVYPSAVDEIVRRVPGVGEYRVMVKNAGAMAELEVEIEPVPGKIEAQEINRAVLREFAMALGCRVNVRVVDIGSLPRGEMKARRWVRV